MRREKRRGSVLRRSAAVYPNETVVSEAQANEEVTQVLAVAADPTRTLDVRIDWGDGVQETVSVPAGRGVRRVVVRHRYVFVQYVVYYFKVTIAQTGATSPSPAPVRPAADSSGGEEQHVCA